MTRTRTVEIPEPIRLKALSDGEAGKAWIADLPRVLADLAVEWQLLIGRTLLGGTEAYVAEVTLADGRGAVLKVCPPGPRTAIGELNTLLAARGRGYAEVYDYDRARRAVLMERLGPALGDLGLPVDAQLVAICTTLQKAWAPMSEGAQFRPGFEKAKSLGRFIEATWIDLGRPCRTQTIDRALRYSEIRSQRFDPGDAVLVHGDPHAWNTLRVLGKRPNHYRFIDPIGLFVERAYDLGIQMREWTSELLVGDPVTLGRLRCQRLSELTGVDSVAIWQWGLIERTASGLLSMKVGFEDASDILAVADAWARSDFPL